MNLFLPSVKNKTFAQFCQEYYHHYGFDFKPAYSGPKFDAHTHIRSIQSAIKSLQFAKEFHINKILGIVNTNLKSKLNRKAPNTFTYARFFLAHPLIYRTPSKISKKIDSLDAEGYKIIKLWFAPRWKNMIRERAQKKWKISSLTDDFFIPFFEGLEKNKMRLLVHISDPDLWYQKKYLPESKYGSKDEHLKELEVILERYPNLYIQGAHLAAQPECLDNLARLLNKYPHFFVDISSARWMGRELSKSPEKTKDFFNKYQDRLFFGTDLTLGKKNIEKTKEYFYTRYLTYITLFESKIQGLPLPFQDPENNNKTIINGLNLSQKILEKIYWDNAFQFYNI